MSPLCAQKLARLKTIVAERAAGADQLAHVKRLHGWLLEVEHLLDASPAQEGEVVSNATVGSRLDAWRAQMATRLSDGTLSDQEREYLTESYRCFPTCGPTWCSVTTGRSSPAPIMKWKAVSAGSRPATAASAAARTGMPICCATGVLSHTTSGGSKMPPGSSN